MRLSGRWDSVVSKRNSLSVRNRFVNQSHSNQIQHHFDHPALIRFSLALFRNLLSGEIKEWKTQNHFPIFLATDEKNRRNANLKCNHFAEPKKKAAKKKGGNELRELNCVVGAQNKNCIIDFYYKITFNSGGAASLSEIRFANNLQRAEFLVLATQEKFSLAKLFFLSFFCSLFQFSSSRIFILN